MLGIESWQDLSAVIIICTAAVGAITWLVRVAVVHPLRNDIQKLTDRLTYELALESDEPMRTRVVRMDSEMTGLRGRVKRLESNPNPNRG